MTLISVAHDFKYTWLVSNFKIEQLSILPTLATGRKHFLTWPVYFITDSGDRDMEMVREGDIVLSPHIVATDENYCVGYLDTCQL